MLVNRNKEIPGRDAHYAAAARRFALDARMLRCRAAVHVENKDDVQFWGAVLGHVLPGDRFHFIAGSRNEYGHETCGVTQCLKYRACLSPGFVICIDSDYRYLLRARGMDARHYVLQTYTYSFENHHCFAGGLDDVCRRATRLPNTVFDFGAFLRGYSRGLYELFVWHLHFQQADPDRFSQADFNGHLSLPAGKDTPIVPDNGARALDALRERAERRLDTLRRQYPGESIDADRERLRALGLTPDTAYLFVRGHNLYDLVLRLCKEVCKAILRKAREGRRPDPGMVAELYRNRNSLDQQLRRNIKYGAYLPIRRLEEDIRACFGQGPLNRQPRNT